MKFNTHAAAEAYRDRAFESTGTSLMIVMMENHLYVTTRREAARLEKQGYEVF
ncbi:hypothetical protein [Tellurirhabdus rosea]|uniref:hypothetical protein n=1 Tax=Tellurirhabdus rosea TaxID=2674997 RepID=UPI0022543D80|nr:hypothetical protein [Tellurirhabdus rosea]